MSDLICGDCGWLPPIREVAQATCKGRLWGAEVVVDGVKVNTEPLQRAGVLRIAKVV